MSIHDEMDGLISIYQATKDADRIQEYHKRVEALATMALDAGGQRKEHYVAADVISTEFGVSEEFTYDCVLDQMGEVQIKRELEKSR